MVEKLTLNYLATALLDIRAVSMPIASLLKSCDTERAATNTQTGQFHLILFI
jgi:hypothetical protein